MFAQPRAQSPNVKLFRAFNFGGSSNATPYSLVFSNEDNDQDDYVPYVTESNQCAKEYGLLRFEEANQVIQNPQH